MKDLGTVGKFLGMNVDVSESHTKLHLTDIDNLLWDFNMESAPSKATPAVREDLSIDEEIDWELSDESTYRSLIGKLLYAANTVRFDISFIVLGSRSFFFA